MASGLGGLWRHSYSNVRDEVNFYFKATGAADVDASGYTLNWGEGVTSVTKNAEGEVLVTLARTYPSGSLRYANLVLSDTAIGVASFTVVKSVDEDASGGAQIVFTVNNGSDVDPDSTVLYGHIVFQGSGT